MEFSFEYADKAALEGLLPRLYDLLQENMRAVLPPGEDAGLEEWLSRVRPAMEKKARQIVLFYAGGELAGYFQYAVNAPAATLMMEEIQIKPAFQGSGLFRAFYTWLMPRLPQGLSRVQAYTHRENLRSQAILEHIGLERTGAEDGGRFFSYLGDFAGLRRRFE